MLFTSSSVKLILACLNFLWKISFPSATVEFFDPSVHLRIDDTEIQIQDICDLTGDVFETIEISC